MENPETIEKTKLELWRVIELTHKEISYWQILRLMPEIIEGLIMKADVEYWIKQHQN